MQIYYRAYGYDANWYRWVGYWEYYSHAKKEWRRSRDLRSYTETEPLTADGVTRLYPVSSIKDTENLLEVDIGL